MNVLNISASQLCLSVTQTFLAPIQTTREKCTTHPPIQSVLEALYYSSATWTDSIYGLAARPTECIFTTIHNGNIPTRVFLKPCARLKVTNDIYFCYFPKFCFMMSAFDFTVTYSKWPVYL